MSRVKGGQENGSDSVPVTWKDWGLNGFLLLFLLHNLRYAFTFPLIILQFMEIFVIYMNEGNVGDVGEIFSFTL